MAVIGIAQERSDSPKATFEWSKYEFTRNFLVVCDSLFDDPINAVNAVGIPRIGSPYYGPAGQFSPFARARKYGEITRIADNVASWNVPVYYSTPEPRSETGGVRREKDGEQDNPLLAPTKFNSHDETYQVPMTQIYNTTNGQIQAILNSASLPIENPPTKDQAKTVMTFTRNEDINSPVQLANLLFRNSVNADYFFGYPPGTCKLRSISWERDDKPIQSTGQYFPYLRSTYTIEVQDTWDKQILDAGPWYWDSTDRTTGHKISFKTAEGTPTQGLLNGIDGRQAPTTTVNGVLVPTPSYIVLRPYVWQAFAPLNLPQSPNDISGR